MSKENRVATQARHQDSVIGGAEINFGGAREHYFVWIREEHAGTTNLSRSGSNEHGEEQRLKGIFRPKSEIQAVFPAEDRWSQKKRSSLNLRGIFRPQSEIQAVFLAENRWSQKKCPQKTSIWASICAPVAPLSQGPGTMYPLEPLS